MPEKETIKRAQRDKRQGKSASTQAGEFVREEVHHVREGKHGARSAKQAIAIGLSKARRAGVKLKPRPGTRDKAEESKAGRKPAAKRSRATRTALKKESRSSASRTALARQAHKAAVKRGPAKRSASARKAAATRKRRGT
jgi:hypothetical protein